MLFRSGVKKGTANIVATAADGSKATGTVMITVTQPVTAISITQADIPVVVGRTAQAKIQVLPADANDKTVTWSTSDTSVAHDAFINVRGLDACSSHRFSDGESSEVGRFEVRESFTEFSDRCSVCTEDDNFFHSIPWMEPKSVLYIIMSIRVYVY